MQMQCIYMIYMSKSMFKMKIGVKCSYSLNCWFQSSEFLTSVGTLGDETKSQLSIAVKMMFFVQN